MKRFAQIYNNKIHWIFEEEEMPQFAPPANEIYDITNLSESLFEGDLIIENNDDYIIFKNRNEIEIRLNKKEIVSDVNDNIIVEEKSKKRKYNKKK